MKQIACSIRWALTLWSIWLLSACAQPERQWHIGVSQCSQDEWRSKQNEEMQREASLHQGVTLEVRSVRDDNQQQIADITYFINKGVDLLIVSPNEAHAVTPVVEQAFHAGIPVVVIDRKIESDQFTAFVGADNVQIGEAMGHYVRSIRQRPLRLFEIGGLAGSSPAMERTEGLHHVIDTLQGVSVVGRIDASWNLEAAERQMDSVFQARKDIDLVVAQNDRMARGARMAALRHQALPPLGFIGVDALIGPGLGVEAVMSGELSATFIYPTGGDKVIQTALQILNGEPYARETILFSAQIDDTNARIVKMQGLMLSEQTATVNRLVIKLDRFLEQYNTQKLLLWAVVLILVLLVIVCAFIVQAYWSKVRINSLMKQATQAKLAFFTNVSHDFRTPLTLIADPVEQLLADASIGEKHHFLLTTIQRNVTVLLRLINQTLDFRKYESGKLRLRLHEFDLAQGLREWSEVFNVLAERRHIHFSVDVAPGDYPMIADREKMERILYNLLSNAFKFTPDDGQVTVSLRGENNQIQLTVSDTGIGMPAAHVKHIFENFYQVDVHHSGSGIGLALVKAFVEMHHGTIRVDSHEGEGTIFTLQMPLRQAGTLDEAVQQNVALEVLREGALVEASSAERSRSKSMAEAESEDKPAVLVIDDNSEVRTYIRYLLQEEYRVLEASNGQEGLDLAIAQVPDAILCDVMMPVMDGMACCRALKSDLHTSHIPVMMLTAYAQDEQKIEGYDCGADSYIAKPFSAPLLKSRLRNLLESRRQLQQLYASSLTSPQTPVGGELRDASSPFAPTEASGSHQAEAAVEVQSTGETLTLRDQAFIARFRQLVEERLSDSDLNVEALGAEMGLSRVQLYRKLKALTGSSPVELLRTIRLSRAKELLADSGKSVSEVAYEVGFSSPSYFTKCYKEAFGSTPTAKKN